MACARGHLANGACCAAGRGTTMLTKHVRPIATTTRRTLAATSSGFGWWWCVVPHLILTSEPQGRLATSPFLAGAAVASFASKRIPPRASARHFAR